MLFRSKGIPHCAEIGGCMREMRGIPSGERHELCRALHAEQNAIIQAATLAQSIDGATMYIILLNPVEKQEVHLHLHRDFRHIPDPKRVRHL